jgi:hypothetical protein
MRKTVPSVLKTALAREPEGRGTFSRPRAQFFSSGPTLPVNNVYIFYQIDVKMKIIKIPVLLAN